MLPSGNRFYDWKYESEPEPFMGGRRVAHTRGKVLGGSSSINGMIFQRGNPLDFERWAADPGMAKWDYAHCLPYFKKMETASPGLTTTAATRTARARTRVGVEPAVRRLLRGRAAGRLHADRRRQRLPPGGLRPLRPEPPPRPTPQRRPRLPAPGDGPSEPRRRDAGERDGRALRGRRAIGVEYRTWRGARRTATAGEVVLCGGAFNSPQLLQVSGVGDGDHLARSVCRSSTICRASAPTCRITSRSTSSTRRANRCR